MKFIIKSLLALLVPGCILAGCSSDEPGVDNGSGGSGDEKGGVYIAFSIKVPETDNEGGRAYEIGSDDENKINNIYIYFYDASGNKAHDYVTLTKDNLVATHPGGDNVYREYKTAPIRIDNMSVAHILVITDTPNPGQWQDKNMNELLAFEGRLYGDLARSSFKPQIFYMSNSAYVDPDGSRHRTAPVNPLNFYVTENEASENPVQVYIERVHARVDVDLAADVRPVLESEGNLTGGTLSVDIHDVAVAHSPNKYYAYKSIGGDWANNATLYSVADKRTFWADAMPYYADDLVVPNYPTEAQYSYDAANGVVRDADELFVNYSFNVPAPFSGARATVYTSENVSRCYTKVLLKGNIKLNGANATVVRWGGMMFTEVDYKNRVLRMLRDDGYGLSDMAPITETMIDWYQGEAHFNLVKAGKIKAYENAFRTTNAHWEYRHRNADGSLTTLSEEQMNEVLLGIKYKVWYYKNGATYYFADIRSGLAGQAGARDCGIIRNHIYRVNVKSIQGYGTPVANPDEVIIPRNPEDQAFHMAVDIVSLQWNKITQGGDFNGEPK